MTTPLGTPKRTDVPKFWADKPDQWWEHVRGCKDCRQFFEPPGEDPA